MSVFAFLKCVAAAFAGVASHELQILLQKRMKWRDANNSKFIETWKDYVDPSGAAATEAPRLCGMDNTLPDKASADYHHDRD